MNSGSATLSDMNDAEAIDTQPRATWQLWRNPIFRRYCQARLRLKHVLISLLLTQLVTGFLFSIARVSGIARSDMDVTSVERLTLMPIIVIQGIILFIFGTAQTSGGMISERDEGQIDYQRLMPIRPLEKALGYLFGLPVREYVMFLSTLPYSIWACWKGEVPITVFFSFYAALFCSALLYHLTGLLTGTVAKNRRWAFLASIGIVFALYTVIPELSRFGLTFFRYLTIRPVIEENLAYFLPWKAERIVQRGMKLISDAPFFGLSFSATVFTLFCQSGLIVGFLIMIQRRWQRAESLLLGKISAVLLNGWIHLLLLGNALPLIDKGDVFPSREISRTLRIFSQWRPSEREAMLICTVYLALTYLIGLFMINLCTPHLEMQRQAWRKARKYSLDKISPLSDAGTSFWSTVIIALTGVGAWFWFSKSVIESRFYPGHFLGTNELLWVGGTLFVLLITFQAWLESIGRPKLFLLGIFSGIVPLMVAAVLWISNDELVHLSIWVAGISPPAVLCYSLAAKVSISELPLNLSRTIPSAFLFWSVIHAVSFIYAILHLIKTRRRIRLQS